MSMRTVMPALWHWAMAPLTSGLRGSDSPTTATRVRSRSRVSASRPSRLSSSPGCGSMTSFNARASVLHPCRLLHLILQAFHSGNVAAKMLYHPLSAHKHVDLQERHACSPVVLVELQALAFRGPGVSQRGAQMARVCTAAHLLPSAAKLRRMSSFSCWERCSAVAPAARRELQCGRSSSAAPLVYSLPHSIPFTLRMWVLLGRAPLPESHELCSRCQAASHGTQLTPRLAVHPCHHMSGDEL